LSGSAEVAKYQKREAAENNIDRRLWIVVDEQRERQRQRDDNRGPRGPSQRRKARIARPPQEQAGEALAD
jgi:hypothetical protein